VEERQTWSKDNNDRCPFARFTFSMEFLCFSLFWGDFEDHLMVYIKGYDPHTLVSY